MIAVMGESTTTVGAVRLQFGVAYVVLLLIAALPLMLTTYLPLYDYHNHLARMHILLQDGDDPLLNQFYRTNWQVLPNLAMDVVVPWLAELMPLEHAARLFTGLIFVLITTGTVALYAALHRELSWWPLLAFLFLYNRILLFGHLNYLAGVGLFLWTLAAWVHLRERPPLLCLAVFSVLATVLFFAHLYALGFYAIAIVGYELGAAARRPGGMRELMRRSPVVLGQFLIPAYLFVFHSPTAEHAEIFSYFGPWWHFWNKVRAVHQVLVSYHGWFDRLTFVVLAAALVAALTLRWVELDRRMWLPLLLLLLVFLALPQALLGALLVDFRLPAGIVFVVIASLRPGRIPCARAVAAALAALFVLRMGLVSERWYAADQVYDRYLEAIEGLPPGSKFVTATAQRPAPDEAFEPALMYVNALAVIEKSGFEPMVFAIPGQQPIAVTEDYRLLASSHPWEWPAAPLEKLAPGLAGTRGVADPARREGLLFEYDYLLLLYPHDASNPAPALLDQLDVTPQFHLYRIRRPPQRRGSPLCPGEGRQVARHRDCPEQYDDASRRMAVPE